jgi:hypothetical protein
MVRRRVVLSGSDAHDDMRRRDDPPETLML